MPALLLMPTYSSWKLEIHISFHEGPRDKKLFWWKYGWVLLRFSMEFPHPRYMILLHFSCSFISSALKMNLIWLFGHDILNNNAQFHEKTTRHHNLWVKLSTHWRHYNKGDHSKKNCWKELIICEKAFRRVSTQIAAKILKQERADEFHF